MKIDIKRNRGFKPFKVEVEIETVDELKELILRLGLAGEQVKEVYIKEAANGNHEYPFEYTFSKPIKTILNLYDALDAELDYMGIPL